MQPPPPSRYIPGWGTSSRSFCGASPWEELFQAPSLPGWFNLISFLGISFFQHVLMGFLLQSSSGPNPSSERDVSGVGSRKRRGTKLTWGNQGQGEGKDAEFWEMGENSQWAKSLTYGHVSMSRWIRAVSPPGRPCGKGKDTCSEM